MFLSLLAGLILWTADATAQPIHVVASTTGLAAVAAEVGGALVTVEALCRADQDPHGFEIMPAQMAGVRQAQLYLKVGLGLDAWADRVIASGGSRGLVVIDGSTGIPVIRDTDHPQDAHDAHPAGNPHYWLGPTNLKIVAATVANGLAQADPGHGSDYRANADRFAAQIDSALAVWSRRLGPCRNAVLVSSHPQWDYFARDFNLKIAGTVSGVPGAEPSPRDLAELETSIRGHALAIFLREPFTAEAMPSVLERDTGLRVMIAPSSVGAITAAPDVWSLFDFLTSELSRQCQGTR